MTSTSSNELQTVLDALPLIFFHKDTQNRILRTNQMVADMLDTSIELITGTASEQWFPGEADDYFIDDLKVMRSGQPQLNIIEQFDIPGIGKQWVSTDKHPHFNANGKVDGILVYSRRVDGKTLAEEQRSELEAQVRYAQKLDSIGVLAAGIAHDFNNYLTIIIGGTEMVLDRLESGSIEALPLEESLRAAQEAARIANQLVTYAGKSPIACKPVNLSTLINDFGDMLQASTAKNVDLSLHLDFNVEDIYADIAQIHQLLVNIAINASEAIGDEHGRICISTSERYCTARELFNTMLGASLASGPYVSITIKDSGCGMSSEVLKSVFEPFFSTKNAGRGLGLATVIGIVKGHGGTLNINSSEEGGTCIEILFPALADSGHSGRSRVDQLAGSPAEEESLPAGTTRQISGQADTVLIVDDNERVRDVLQNFLCGAGYVVLSADSGEEALSMIEKITEPLSAAIVDYCMPVTNGLELFEQLRQRQSALPFLLVSGSANLGSTQEFENLSNVAFLKKPFNREAILHKLRALLDRARAECPD